MRRSSSGATPNAAAQPGERGHRAILDEETPRLPAAGSGPLPVAEEGAPPVPPPPRLGIGVPAVAVSQQAGQGPEEVVLYFGIIDFLQVSPCFFWCLPAGLGETLPAACLGGFCLACNCTVAPHCSQCPASLLMCACPAPPCLPTAPHPQEYNMRKKLEHSFKALVQDGKTISGECGAGARGERLLQLPQCHALPQHATLHAIAPTRPHPWPALPRPLLQWWSRGSMPAAS
jgi:hypothetical protein